MTAAVVTAAAVAGAGVVGSLGGKPSATRLEGGCKPARLPGDGGSIVEIVGYPRGTVDFEPLHAFILKQLSIITSMRSDAS